MSHEITRTARPQYTEAELYARAENLPGFISVGDISDIYENPDTTYRSLWQPVLSATVVSNFDGELHVLTGKRTAEGNTTHVNVASTPTMRIPSEEAGLLVYGSQPFSLSGKIDPLRPFVSENLEPSVASLPDSIDPLSAKVAGLLALKLQLGAALESSRGSAGRTSLARYVVGFSYLQDAVTGEPLYEPLIMFGALVGLNPEVAEQVPEQTVSYSNLGWAPIDQYVRGVATRSLIDVIPSASPEDDLELCVRGLCNATSSTILSDSSEIRNHLAG